MCLEVFHMPGHGSEPTFRTLSDRCGREPLRLWRRRSARAVYNVRMAPVIPAEIHGQRYISLATFRKSGIAVLTPVWFSEDDGKLYVMTSSKLGKYKRIRNNPQVKIAPCTMRGKITGPEFPATARIMKPEEFERARKGINAKYWLARIPFLWPNTDAYLEITPAAS